MTRRNIAILFVLTVAVAAVGGTIGVRWNSPKKVQPSNTGPLILNGTLFALPSSPYQVGTVGRGERFEFAICLHNESESAIELGPVETSCDCLEVILSERRVESGRAVTGTIAIDFRKNPTYTGGLLLTVEASTVEPNPRKAFSIRLSADVK